ncbi:MAG: hypothetical protein HC906_11175 [Bacteroidales bacterium]|nr:hypothetical protein [Bacteroidales bacterium]
MNNQIARLNTRINNLDSTIGRLNNFNTSQTEQIGQITRRLNTAYFIVGDEKDLLEKNVIYKDGGFLGFLGQVERLNPELKTDLFTQIDIRNDNLIEVRKENGNDKINVITYHPPESFTLTDVNDNLAQLEITDPELFWQASKYLVVLKE